MKKQKVVIIDDDSVTLKLLSTLLGEEGMEVRVTQDPVIGHQMVKNEQPDLIILDVHMPNIDGLELLWTFRRYPSTYNIPILMLTSEAMFKSTGIAFELGANAYCTKPFAPKELKERVAELLENSASTPPNA